MRVISISNVAKDQIVTMSAGAHEGSKPIASGQIAFQAAILPSSLLHDSLADIAMYRAFNGSPRGCSLYNIDLIQLKTCGLKDRS